MKNSICIDGWALHLHFFHSLAQKHKSHGLGEKTMDIFKRFVGGDGIMCCVREVWTGDFLGLESIIT